MVYGYALDEADGSISHVVGLFNNFKKRNEVICFARKSKNIKYKLREIVYVPLFDKRIFREPSFQLTLFLYLFYYCIKIRPDVIYARQSGPTFSPAIISKLFRIPYFVEINGLIIDEIKITNASKSLALAIYLAKLSERVNYKCAEKIIAVTKGIKEGIKKLYNIPDEKIVVIGNGADTDLFKPSDQKEARKELKFEQDANYVCFVGNLYPWQGVEYLVQSAPLILKEIPDAKFLIVGDGAIKNDLIKMVKELNLEEKFIFTANIPHEEVPKYINASDVCIVPKKPLKSGYSPLKLYEYMACGKPVVASKISGFEILEENNAGISAEPENPEKLAKATIKILKNEKLMREMGENGREYVIKNHSWENIARNIVRVCENVTGEV